MIRKTFWIATEIYSRLEKLAKRQGCKPADLFRRAIFEFLEREEGK